MANRKEPVEEVGEDLDRLIGCGANRAMLISKLH